MAADLGQPRINGWLVLARPAFARPYATLRDEARRLKETRSADVFARHPTVKLAASIHRLVTNIVPQDPDRPEFRLRGDLSAFRRAKGFGLPPRYRLFWTFSAQERVIIFLYLNDPRSLRKEGARSDPYEVFRRLLRRGEIGADFAASWATWVQEDPEGIGRSD